MIDKDRLLRRLLRRIRQHGYYHHTDVALVHWLSSSESVQKIAEIYGIRKDAIYKQKERLAAFNAQEEAS